MQYKSRMGNFPTLQEMRYAYLKSGVDMCLDTGHANANEWDKSLLHASELGGCPRQMMLRIAGTEEKQRLNLTEANDAMMFWVANRLHFLAFEAMDWAELLFGHEVSLFEPPWAGRADAIFHPDFESDELMLYDMKTVRPNAMKYTESFPKEAHCLQLGAYATKLPYIERGIVEYVDRGGSNPPIECVIDLAPWREKAAARMAELESQLGSFPLALDETLVAHYRKENGKPSKYLNRISAGCDWRCSYCPYVHTLPPKDDNDKYPAIRPESPCHPAWHAPKDLATMKGGKWTYLTGSDSERDMVEAFIAAQPRTVPLIGGSDE